MRNLIAALAIGLVASSCAPSTPQARIQQHPEIFAALPAKERELVQRGEITKGMSQNAVLLAWGPPTLRYDGYHNGRSSQRWDYTAAQPVYTTGFYGAYGYGGYYGRGYRGYHGYYGPYSGYGFGFAPEVTYVPYHKSSVWFVNNRVDAWESLR